MPKFRVKGTININWETEVQADSVLEAEGEATEKAADGDVEFSDPVSEPEITNVEEL